MSILRRTFSPDELRSIVSRIFESCEVPKQDADRVAECLVLADIRGVSTHGVSRVPIYTRRLRCGAVKARPNLSVTRRFTVAASVDADNGLGFIAATRAMREAIVIGKEHGVGMAMVRHSNHFGMAASYLRQATKAGLAAYAFTNASPAMPIWGGREPFLGTSPFAFAAPLADGEIMLDMALSVVARGKVRRAAQRGESIPLGWALDSDGNPTTDAQKGYEGVVLPLGGAKGSGLSLMMEIIGGVMSGAAFAGEVNNQYQEFDQPQNVGHCFIAFRPDLCMSASDYQQRMEALRVRCKAQARAAAVEEILLPGEPEERLERRNNANGIVLEGADFSMLLDEAKLAGFSI